MSLQLRTIRLLLVPAVAIAVMSSCLGDSGELHPGRNADVLRIVDSFGAGQTTAESIAAVLCRNDNALGKCEQDLETILSYHDPQYKFDRRAWCEAARAQSSGFNYWKTILPLTTQAETVRNCGEDRDGGDS